MANRTHRIVQITDTHIVDEGEMLYGSVDTAANLQHALETVADNAEGLDALVLTGDLANDGSPDAYRRLRAIVDPAAERLGVPVFYGIGNHDHRDAFRSGLLDGAAAPAGTLPAGTESDGQRGELAPVDYVVDLDGLRIVMVDSTVPGSHRGELTLEQLGWLATTLAEPAPAGTLLTIHHPPFNTAKPETDAVVDLMASAMFDDFSGLGEALRGTDVMTVLAGHYHEPLGGQLAGVPVWAGPSTAMSHEVGPDTFRIVPSSGYSVIDVFDDRTVVARAINCLPRPVLFEMSMADLREHIEQAAH
ncbi:metallophosphoesterase [Desertimonas flava]|uniref:metallophosphoesterase n=1 Tax=Desertimonas flava TaxID=2064846 RepID=UPI000E340F95|nr:metallophosphoesterase [Desertimonas flava]